MVIFDIIIFSIIWIKWKMLKRYLNMKVSWWRRKKEWIRVAHPFRSEVISINVKLAPSSQVGSPTAAYPPEMRGQSVCPEGSLSCQLTGGSNEAKQISEQERIRN